MKAHYMVVVFSVIALAVHGAWYWPFSSEEEEARPRLSELMETASVMIDDATDLAADDKVAEAVAKYREAIAEIDRIERENDYLADLPEANSLRNKRAYVNAAIDSLLLSEAQNNAKPVAVTDTTELQKKYDAKKGKKTDDPVREVNENEDEAVIEEAAEPAAEPKPVRKVANTRDEKLKLAVADFKAKDFAAAELGVGEILEMEPNDPAAMNLKAAIASAKGEYREAERILDLTIQSNPRSYYAYYNMAKLMIEGHIGSMDAARRYYDTGRQIGGPVNEQIEKALK